MTANIGGPADPSPTPNVNTPVKKRPMWMTALIGLVLVCVVLGIISAIANPKSNTTTSTNNLSSQTAAGPTNTAAPAQAAAPTEVAQAQPTDPPAAAPTDTPVPKAAGLGVGSTGTTGGLKVTVNGVRHSDKGLVPPKAGMEYLVVDVTIENAGDKEAAISSLLMESLKDGSGQKYTVTIGADAKASADGKIAPGDKSRGETSFEVPLTATGLVFIFDPVFGDALRFNLDK
ncbi:MAG: DUF4352 domain-containing protein [Chloroflexia bacterium]